ncbi:tripartite tricarboxylate transporter TctB family protein [Billgrantia endophytica]|uniref:DUF1468 domain-containing protein n=1 Tax=Billgrantia endophytica TaxID=2033802 RepID=A0A2N7UBS8_9GAMM|nr:tripartite tricarboxylate transporter TctB family protein [Halomonas endophytica]PMR77892.1 hypothetical protein C1H69_00840 [Halomonas endophytica]
MSDRQPSSHNYGWVLGATLVFLVGSIGAALFLLPPTLEMSFGGMGRPVGPGTVPIIVLTLTILMVLIVALQEVLYFCKRRGGKLVPIETTSDESSELEASALRKVIYAVATLALLVAFLLLWRNTAFPVAASAFSVILSFCLLPAGWRRPKHSLSAAVIAIIGVLVIWLLFEFILNIRLH